MMIAFNVSLEESRVGCWRGARGILIHEKVAFGRLAVGAGILLFLSVKDVKSSSLYCLLR